MKHLLPILFLWISLFSHAADSGDQVTHVPKIYKAIDSMNVKVDVFYTKQSFEREDNTAVVFFYGGGWAYGVPSDFYTTSERYAKMRFCCFCLA
ncbi:MAG: hypothetical protein AB2L20_27100 [Mangrovibacterium sp.]